MIDERIVLPGIKHFEQGAGGIAAKVCADLVDLVEHEHRIPRADAPEFLNKTPWHGTNVRAAMATDFRLISNPAKAHAGELAAKGVGDRLSEACLSHTRRTKKAENRSAALGIQLFRTARYSINRRFTFSSP